MNEQSDKITKKAKNLMNLLLNKQQNKVPSELTKKITSIEDEIDKRTIQIKKSIEIINEAKREIRDDLHFLKEHQDEFKKHTKSVFEEYNKSTEEKLKS